jgi:hypothetical protein
LTGARIDANGQPVKSYTKDLIRDGEWVLPKTGDRFQVTPELREHWVAEFDRMTANGVKVPVPNGHTVDAVKNYGYVTRLFNDGDTLFMGVDIIGEEGIKATSSTEVSVFVPPSVTGGKGEVYPRAIAHVALTPIPVVSGQGKFIPDVPYVTIAASRDSKPENVPVYRLANSNGDSTVNENLMAICKALGIDASGMKDDAEATAAIMAKIQGAEAAQKDATKAKDAAVAAARDATAALALAREGPKFTHLETKAVRTSRRMALDAVVAGGHVTLACAKALSTIIAPDGDAIALSLTPDLDAMVDGVVAALKLNDPKVLGEQTRAQSAVALSRETPGDTNRTADQIKSDIDALYRLAPA